MSDLAEMRAQLRGMRKEMMKPVSRMGKRDCAAEIERLKHARETTAHAAAVPSAASRRMESAAESLKEAKRHEFPAAPASAGTKKGMERKTARKAYEEKPAEKKRMSKKEMMALLSEMTSDEE
jgi:hypothetical protein